MRQFLRRFWPMLLVVVLLLVLLGRDVLFTQKTVSGPRFALDAKIELPSDAGSSDSGPGLAAVPASDRVITGIVVDETDRPIAGATVHWFLPAELGIVSIPIVDAVARSARADEEGRFTLSCVDGDVAIRAMHQGYAAGELAMIDARGREVRLVLRKGGALSGRVLTSAGQPIFGAQVLAIGMGFDRRSVTTFKDVMWGPRVDAQSSLTDGDGRFEIAGLGLGHYEVVVPIPGLLRKGFFGGALLAKAGDEVELVLDPYVIVAFRLVEEESGSPVLVSTRAVAVPDLPYFDSVMPIEAEVWCGGAALSNRSDPGGAPTYVSIFRVAEWPIPKGATATVKVMSDVYANAEAKVPLQLPWGGANRILDVAVRPREDTGEVAAKFLGADGEALGRLRARLFLKDGRGHAKLVDLRTDSAGMAVFRLPVGDYVVRGQHDDLEHWSANTGEVVSDRPTEWIFRLQSAYVRLSLIDSRGLPILPLAGVRVASCIGNGPVVLRLYNFPSGDFKASPSKSSMWPHVEGSREAMLVESDQAAVFSGQCGPFPPGRRTFEVYVPRFAPASVTVDLSSGEVLDVNVLMQPTTDEWYPQQAVEHR